MAYNRIFIIVLLYLYSLVNCGQICSEDYCNTYRRDPGCSSPAEECSINNDTHTGMWMPSPTECNCCEYCLPLYSKNSYCSTGGPGTGTTIGRCGHGLTCIADPDHSYCTRMESECHSKQDDYDARHSAGEIGALEARPECDGKGKYAAFDCVPAHTCFCQSEDGERLFGEILYSGVSTGQNMHCPCSRMHAKIEKSITPGVPSPVIGLRCTSDGNFNPIQCINRTCYCVDRFTGAILEGENRMIHLDEKPVTKLSCYDATVDLFPQQSVGEPPYNYTTPCIEEMLNKIALIAQSVEEGYNVDYFSSVSGCMPDGTYGRVASTRNGSKICVDEWGDQIKDYEVWPNTSEYNSMDCKCAQTLLVMAESAEKPVCCKNGNFRRIQCRRGLCRCVDSDGRQTERESADVTALSCYTDDWRTC